MLGSVKRVNQYFHKNTRIKTPNFLLFPFFHLLHYLYNFLKTTKTKPENNYIIKILLLIINCFKESKLPLVCTIHGYTAFHKFYAKAIGMPLFCMQDGFLPKNYTSRYFKYFEGVSEFLIWDLLSINFFFINQLSFRKSKLFSPCTLPKLPFKKISIKNVLVLTSGAGDWTALKNRSDDDKLFELFIKVAKTLPNINIIYRPHPLWVHPSHQGVNSINRLNNYLEAIEVDNMKISRGSTIESEEFKVNRSLSMKSISIDEEIQAADLVFGEHSQTLIKSAKIGKLFGSVNATNRRDLFSSISEIGFPHFNSHNQVINFIEKSSSFINEYNNLITDYNKMVKYDFRPQIVNK